MRFALAPLLLLVAGCGPPADRCRDGADACLVVRVKGEVAADELRVVVCGAAVQDSYSQPLGRAKLPVTIVEELPLRAAGKANVSVVALRSGVAVGFGATATTVVAHKRGEVVVVVAPITDTTPILTCVSPNRASTKGGTKLTVSGANFNAGAGPNPELLWLGVAAATEVTVLSSVELTAIVPPQPGVFGPVTVTMTNPDDVSVAADGLFSFYLGGVTFADGLFADTPGGYRDLVVADFDGDGRSDAALLDRDVLQVWRGQLEGHLGAGQTVDVKLFGDTAAAADFDRDGRIDLVVGSQGADQVAFHRGAAGGMFAAAGTTSSSGPSPHAFNVADLDGDGRLDLVASTFGDNSITSLLGRGDGNFAITSSVEVPTLARGLSTGDLDGDGHPDVVAWFDDDQQLRMLRGRGDGTLEAPGTFSVGLVPTAVRLADLDGDGRLDLIAVGTVEDRLVVFRGRGDGTFEAPINSKTKFAGMVNLTIADLNGDGRPDAAVAPADGGVLILLGSGDGRFVEHVSFGGDRCDHLLTGDVNGDRRLDLITVELHFSGMTKVTRLAVYLSTGT